MIKNMYILFKGELKRYWTEVLTYYPDHIVSMIITTILFSIFSLLDNNTTDSGFYVGYVYWYLTSALISEGSVTISAEKQLGTLSQLLLSPYRFETIITIRTVVWSIINFIKVITVLCVLTLCIGIRLKFSLALIPIFILTSIGIFGLTLLLVALTLKFTKIASFEQVISFALLFLSGSIVSIDALPSYFQGLSQLMPLTMGIEISRNILNSLYVPVMSYVRLAGQSIVYLGIGYGLFILIHKQSKKSGINTSY
jgi:ABC-2 type transport system permease protein